MPQIKVRGIEAEQLCVISEQMIATLAEVIQCPMDYLELEYIQSVAIRNGVLAPAYPFVEIAWFDRGLEIQDKVASVITQMLKDKLGIEGVDLAFTTFEHRHYYENGKHF